MVIHEANVIGPEVQNQDSLTLWVKGVVQQLPGSGHGEAGLADEPHGKG